MIEGRDLFRFCACCPNPCRRAVPAGDDGLQTESQTPSALSLIALAVIDGALPFDEGTRRALARTAAAHACRPACPYGFDIAGAIDAFRSQQEPADAQSR
ncbi:hypothetical protein V4F39_25380 [Aquincola sp. MAHUQ-54]|uniref:Uncharacterized protein n=1 Tax=Aquincola agrisoli TaxID=3119538 RepID=A0AAW9QPG6_9BURK